MAGNLGKATLYLTGDAQALQKSLGGLRGTVQKSLGGLGGILKNALGFAAGGLLQKGIEGLTGSVVDLAKSFVEEASAAQLVATQTDAVIKSTGGAAGMTAEAVADLASNLAGLTMFEDDAIQSGENLLLTFTNIGKDVFPAATKAILDISQAMGQDIQSSAVQLGKALNDPIAGISSLTRVGVTFTEQQKEQIKALVASGKVAEAQKIILQEIQKEFGGAAEAAGTTFAGKWKHVTDMIGNFKEAIGKPLLDALSKLIDQYFPSLQAAAETFTTWITETALPYIFEQLIPTLARWIPEAIATLKTTWDTVLMPALTGFAGTMDQTVIPSLNGFIGLLKGDLPAALASPVKPIADAITWLNNLQRAVNEAGMAIHNFLSLDWLRLTGPGGGRSGAGGAGNFWEWWLARGN